MKLIEQMRGTRLLLVAIVVSATVITALAARRNSSTFDEIAPIAIGARGWKTLDWGMMPDFPPVMQYLYGLPVALSAPNYPAEPHKLLRYQYARTFLWQSGNDAEKLIFRARLVAALAVATLILLTFAFARAHFGPTAGLLAAGIVAFMPDVMAHGGVAYNDIALAPAFLAALWAIDAGVRRPSIRQGIIAGALVSLALGIKHSALALGPVAVILVALELFARTERREWGKQVAITIAVAAAVGYIVQALLYRGDFDLSALRTSTMSAVGHIAGGHGPSYLLGEFRAGAAWYFYPVAFLFKTSVAFQLLLLLALYGAARAWPAQERLRALLLSPARAPVAALLTFGYLLLTANLAIGFRYALPLLPLFAILAAAGCAVVWQQSRALRALVLVLVVWCAGSTLSFYPNFLTYTSEHQPDRNRGWEVFVDSSLDWGQGLIALREFMREEGVSQVYLGYFGSALPEGYGIDYIPLPSFIPLNPRPQPAGPPPRFAVVSGTLLVGQYLPSDVYAQLRAGEPYRVLGRSLYVYRAEE